MTRSVVIGLEMVRIAELEEQMRNLQEATQRNAEDLNDFKEMKEELNKTSLTNNVILEDLQQMMITHVVERNKESSSSNEGGRLEILMLGFFGEKGKETINSYSNGVTSENSLPMPKETLNLQGSSSSVMESGIQSITLGVFSPTPEAINTDAWIKDEDERNFDEKISRSLKHFNSQSDGNNDQDLTLNLNSSIRDGCLEEESFGIQDDTRINSADKNIEILKGMLLGPRLVKISGNKKVVSLAENVFIKGEDIEVYEEEKYWNLVGSIFELRSCNHMILKENEFEIWRRQRKKMNSLSWDDCIGNLCCNDKVNCKSVMRFDKKNYAESIFPFAGNFKEKYEMASIYS